MLRHGASLVPGFESSPDTETNVRCIAISPSHHDRRTRCWKATPSRARIPVEGAPSSVVYLDEHPGQPMINLRLNRLCFTAGATAWLTRIGMPSGGLRF